MDTKNVILSDTKLAGKATKIKEILEDKAGEIPKASMKGKRNEGNRLIAFAFMKTHNNRIIEEASEIIKILQEENRNLQKVIDDIQKHAQ